LALRESNKNTQLAAQLQGRLMSRFKFVLMQKNPTFIVQFPKHALSDGWTVKGVAILEKSAKS